MAEQRHCAVCGKRVRMDGHHLTGRGPDGGYLDDDLVADLCHDHHELVGDDHRQQHIYDPVQSLNVLERLEYRLRRVATFLARVARGTGVGWCTRLAGSLVRWATELRVVIIALDLGCPGWRTII